MNEYKVHYCSKMRQNVLGVSYADEHLCSKNPVSSYFAPGATDFFGALTVRKSRSGLFYLAMSPRGTSRTCICGSIRVTRVRLKCSFPRSRLREGHTTVLVGQKKHGLCSLCALCPVEDNGPYVALRFGGEHVVCGQMTSRSFR